MTVSFRAQAIREELHPAWLIARREVRDQFSDWRVIIPVVLLTAFFPFLMNIVIQQMLQFVEKYGAVIVAERLIPLLLMIVGFFPISMSLVIALETFVGEKERGSIEPLLDSPLKDWQLYFGKMIASTAPPLVGSFVGMAVYLIGLIIQRVPLPETSTIIMVFILTIVQAIMMVSGAVVVSAQATSVRAANLLASFIIIPSAFLIQLEAVIMFWGRNVLDLWWMVAAVLILSYLLIRLGISHFQREKLLGREIDILNFKWMWQTFWNSFWGKEKNIFTWYRHQIFPTLRKLGWGLLVAIIIAGAGFILGWQLVRTFPLPTAVNSIEELNENMQSLVDTAYFSQSTAGFILRQNLRVIFLAGLLGSLTFGLAGAAPLLSTFAAVGYLINLLTGSGIPIAYLLALLLPHGSIELPALLLATSATLFAAAKILAPSPQKGIGEIWLEAIAVWFKITLGLCVPAFILAAFIEAFLTPQIVLWLF
ncbi:MAG: stage II sporulation protein M [Anaerolineae bacterium]|jgi:uncharacterized membrane protein SpoIIM required for sporulation|nr:stage II sporulation protein M [Anaerolineae bacterium]